MSAQIGGTVWAIAFPENAESSCGWRTAIGESTAYPGRAAKTTAAYPCVLNGLLTGSSSPLQWTVEIWAMRDDVLLAPQTVFEEVKPRQVQETGSLPLTPRRRGYRLGDPCLLVPSIEPCSPPKGQALAGIPSRVA